MDGRPLGGGSGKVCTMWRRGVLSLSFIGE